MPIFNFIPVREFRVRSNSLNLVKELNGFKVPLNPTRANCKVVRVVKEEMGAIDPVNRASEISKTSKCPKPVSADKSPETVLSPMDCMSNLMTSRKRKKNLKKMEKLV
jgi:hypothetical protein